MGDVPAAAAWAREHRVGHDDDLSYLREYEHLTLARVLLGRHRADPSSTVAAERRRAPRPAPGRGGVGQPLRHGARGRGAPHPRATDGRATHARARAALAHALHLAEPDGWVRFFVDAGPELGEALTELAPDLPRSAFLEHLTAVVSSSPAPGPGPAGRERQGAAPDLVDPLSDRELDVLRLLGSDLDGPAIARELVVSLNTVRTHTKHIYTKLGVNNRRAAITKAHQSGLLSRRP